MTLTPIGDLAQSFASRNATNRMKSDLGRLTQELSSGWANDQSAKMKGGTSSLSSVNRTLTLLDAYEANAKLLKLNAVTTGAALERIREATEDVVNLSLDKLKDSGTTFRGDLSRTAAGAFSDVVGALNVAAGGRGIFSGTGAGPALASSETILSDLRTRIEVTTNPADAKKVIDDYFGDEGDFFDTAYLGTDTNRSSIAFSQSNEGTLSLRADDEMFRSTLSDLAKMALLNDPSLVPEDNGAVFRDSSETLMDRQTDFLREEAVIGRLETQLETAETRNASERTVLETWRIDTVGADPYETSLRIKETERQLETLFTVTARLSKLSLLNALR